LLQANRLIRRTRFNYLKCIERLWSRLPNFVRPLPQILPNSNSAPAAGCRRPSRCRLRDGTHRRETSRASTSVLGGTVSDFRRGPATTGAEQQRLDFRFLAR
jgi:hypothetical protein